MQKLKLKLQKKKITRFPISVMNPEFQENYCNFLYNDGRKMKNDPPRTAVRGNHFIFSATITQKIAKSCNFFAILASTYVPYCLQSSQKWPL